MTPTNRPHRRVPDCDDHRPPRKGRHRFLMSWLATNSVVAGVCALAWLVLRSGTKPSRFAYPCQQAAITAA